MSNNILIESVMLMEMKFKIISDMLDFMKDHRLLENNNYPRCNKLMTDIVDACMNSGKDKKQDTLCSLHERE